MLEEEVHVDTDAADVAEHVGVLHIIGVGAEAIEAVCGSQSVSRSSEGRLLHVEQGTHIS